MPLEVTYLNGNETKHYTSFDDIDNPKEVKALNYNNQLTSLIGIENLSKLEILDCYHNQLISLKGIENLSNLKRVECTDNQLTSLKGIENLSNLEILDCYGNSIYDYIKTNCNGDWKQYIKDLKAVQLIETWFLEVRYSPDYAYCRRKVNEFYDRVVNKNDNE